MYDAVLAETITITGHGGDAIEAYSARPMAAGPLGGVVVIHHMPGYDAPSKEIVRRFAAEGYAAVCPNLYSREAPGAEPDDAAAAARAAGGVPDERLVGDVAGAAAYLRGLPSSNGKVGTIGYCSGGRQSFLALASLDLQAGVDCYGAFVTGTPPEGFPLQVSPLKDRVKDLRGPLLGLFGNDDQYPSPEHVDELEQELKAQGKPYEFHRYDDAGHAFFAVDRPSYRPAAVVDGWQKILRFYGEHL
ncbi:dienelactone hydrolase family protein [Streptomyces sp. NBC_01497]|uniref:dienelactone hydrolase family protein n=1 Tax=Streptomyces sp. NBC_01497 TaxID=2903885 RepID=UPI002E35ADF6|nr:dienelactone hydrolase family protein [Streptomyces sp. NBC_01497]